MSIVLQLQLKGKATDTTRSGWSFGGLVAVEMAAVAFEDPRLGVDIQGMILIDAPYSCFDSRPLHEIIYGDMPDLPGMAPRQRRRIWASIQRAREMIVDWGSHCAGDDGLNMGTVQQKDVKLPPAVLLRCTDLVRTSDQSVAVVDSCRNDAKLGWGQYGAEFIEVVWNVPGSHYSLFEGQNVSYFRRRKWPMSDLRADRTRYGFSTSAWAAPVPTWRAGQLPAPSTLQKGALLGEMRLSPSVGCERTACPANASNPTLLPRPGIRTAASHSRNQRTTLYQPQAASCFPVSTPMFL